MSIQISYIAQTVNRLCDIIIANEVYFCELDSVAGDGDFGMSLAKGFREVKNKINEIDQSSIAKFLRGCSMIIMEYCGGASGPIWGSAFGAAAASVKEKNEIDLVDISNMFQEAVAAIQKRGGAALGDKTLLDALIPAANTLSLAAEQGVSMTEAFRETAKAARGGAESTKNIVATKGRASYLGERSLGHPDAGAMAIALILEEFTGDE
jgi:dihydroxyacetone kinase